jgi:hypothetical protein
MKEKVNHHKFDLHRFGIIGNLKILLCKLVGHRLNEIEDHSWCGRCGYCYEDIYYKNNNDTHNA